MPDDIGCGCAGIGMEKCVKNVGDGEAVAAGAERKNGWAFYLHYNKVGETDAMVGVCHKTGMIGHLFVTESARGQGIGTKVLDFARKKLPEHEHPTLGVLSPNTRAISLYKRMGWRLNGVLTVHDPAQGAPFAVYCEELRMCFHG